MRATGTGWQTEREGIGVDRAKELFYRYRGNRFYMDHDGVGREYDSYHISKETEALWTEELIARLLQACPRGREALRLYAAAADLLRRGGRGKSWDACLYYPLRAAQLDDVTILYMLKSSFSMAEDAAKKKRFSAREADDYRRELETYAQSLLQRAEREALTRAKDYDQVEFSDPAYTA